MPFRYADVFSALGKLNTHKYSLLMQTHSTASPIKLRQIGVLGGMGPLATVDFLHKVVCSTLADVDQDHVPMVVGFCSKTPDRANALLGLGPSPLGDLIAAAQTLEQSGAELVVMPCNTAHAWFDSVAASIKVPMLHIVDVAVDEAIRIGGTQAIGLLATSGTLLSNIYPSRGGCATWVTSTDDEQKRWVVAGISAIKGGRMAEGAALLLLAAQALVERGAKVIIMGCTEIPLGLAQRDIDIPLIDSSLALARACVSWAGGRLAAEVLPDLAHSPL
jgi:aspartate racemase